MFGLWVFVWLLWLLLVLVTDLYLLVSLFNSIKVTFASRHTQRLHPCKKDLMLPTSARVAQAVYEPLIGIQYPMLCSRLGDTWQIGTASIREDQLVATGLRFVQWRHASENIEA